MRRVEDQRMQWRTSADGGGNSQQNRLVLHCAAASLHLLRDEARRAGRQVGDRDAKRHVLQLA